MSCERNDRNCFKVAGDRTAKSTTNISSLPYDCFVEIFEFLSLQDLHAIGQTSKWLHKFAGSYFKLNFTAAPVGCASNGVYVNGTQLNGFSEFIRSASILLYRIDDDRIHYIDAKCSKAFQQLRLIFVNLTTIKSPHIKNVLRKIETLDMSHCKIDDQFASNFLAFCTNLKRFCMRNCEESTSLSDQWLLQVYPNLEHFEWVEEKRDVQAEQIQTFFKQNRSLRSFATNASFLWKFRQTFEWISINLDDLAIDIDHLTVSKFDTIVKLLQKLLQNGFYRRLHLYTSSLQLSQSSVDKLVPLHALEKIYLRNIKNNVTFHRLVNLKELGIYLCSSSTIFESLAKDLVNLERIYFWKATVHNLVPFIRHSAKLQKIKVQHLETDADFIFILMAVNRERANLARARKVTIYVNENIFLEFKWATDTTDLGFVQIKRADSYEWEHHFGY